MAELINHVSFMVCGYDLTVSMAAQAGQLELNVFKPTISYCLFKSLDMTAEALNLFERFCLRDLKILKGDQKIEKT
jgi:aspartate ammonia-lyase